MITNLREQKVENYYMPEPSLSSSSFGAVEGRKEEDFTKATRVKDALLSVLLLDLSFLSLEDFCLGEDLADLSLDERRSLSGERCDDFDREGLCCRHRLLAITRF